MIKFQHINGDEIFRTPNECILGREGSGQDLFWLFPTVSRKHAEIKNYKIKDLGSKNGTLVNKEILYPNVWFDIHPGDIIDLGGCELRILKMN